MTTGRPSIRPNPDHDTPVVSGLGADKCEVGDTAEDDKLLCVMCGDQDGIFGVEDDVDEELKISEEGKQAVRVVPLPTPYLPTLGQFLDHCVAHYPYQSWCPYCVEGRGRELSHRCVAKESSATPTVSFDYRFLSEGEDINNQLEYEAAGENAVKLLVVRDERSNAIFGHVVPRKGIDGKCFAVDSLVDDAT